MFKSIINRIKKGVRDVGSAATDNSGILGLALPLLLGSGILPGGKKFGLETLLGNLGQMGLGNLSTTESVYSNGRVNEKDVAGTGFLGGAQKILGSLMGGAGGSKEGTSGLLGLLASFLMKKELEKEKARALGGKDNSADYRAVDDKYNSQFGLGSSPNKEVVFGDLQYDPTTGERYDLYNDGKFENYTTDSSGNITNYPVSSVYKGGIPSLKQGGGFGGQGPMPFNPNNQIKGILRRSYGGGTEPEMFDPRMSGQEIFDPRMSGQEMMGEIKENPGITDFFPPKFGEIAGPGGPKDDKIPAMLSDGEFVMTAKAVDNAGGPKAMYNLMNKLDPESSQGKGII